MENTKHLEFGFKAGQYYGLLNNRRWELYSELNDTIIELNNSDVKDKEKISEAYLKLEEFFNIVCEVNGASEMFSTIQCTLYDSRKEDFIIDFGNLYIDIENDYFRLKERLEDIGVE